MLIILGHEKSCYIPCVGSNTLNCCYLWLPLSLQLAVWGELYQQCSLNFANQKSSL